MLARADRLRLRREITAVARQGRSVSGRTLVLQVLPTHGARSRFAVVVSRRTAKRAVDRNRIKRRLRATLFRLKPGLTTPVAGLVRVRPAALALPSSDLEDELRRLFMKLHLFL